MDELLGEVLEVPIAIETQEESSSVSKRHRRNKTWGSLDLSFVQGGVSSLIHGADDDDGGGGGGGEGVDDDQISSSFPGTKSAQVRRTVSDPDPAPSPAEQTKLESNGREYYYDDELLVEDSLVRVQPSEDEEEFSYPPDDNRYSKSSEPYLPAGTKQKNKASPVNKAKSKNIETNDGKADDLVASPTALESPTSLADNHNTDDNNNKNRNKKKKNDNRDHNDKRRKKRRRMLFILITVLVLILGAVVGYFMVSATSEDKDSDSSRVPEINPGENESNNSNNNNSNNNNTSSDMGGEEGGEEGIIDEGGEEGEEEEEEVDTGVDDIVPGLPPDFSPPVGSTTPAPTPLRASVSPAGPLPNDSCTRAIGPLTINGYPEFASLDHDPPLAPPHGLRSTCLLSADDDDYTDKDPSISTAGILPAPAGRWYSVMGGDLVLRVSTCDPTGEHVSIDTKLAVYRGWCGGPTPHARLLCVESNDQFCGDQSSLSWYAEKGVMYYIFVFTTTVPPNEAAVVTAAAQQASADVFRKSDIGNDMFRLRVTYEDNGVCSDAIGPVDNDGKVIIGSMRGANLMTALTCSFFQARFGQVWYKVIGTGDWMAASTCHPITNFEARIDVLSESCSSGTCAGVRDSDCGNGYRLVWQSEAGAEYFILIYKSTNLPGTLFGLTVDSFDPAENDVCVDAIPVEVGGGVVKGTTWTATPDSLPVGLSGEERRRCNLPWNTQPGVWYTVQGTGDTLLVSTCNDDTDFATKITIFRRGCGRLDCMETTDQFCSEKSSVYFDSVMGQEYLIFVHGADYGVSANIGNFGLEVSIFVPEPNDLCVDASPVAANGERVLGSTFAATEDDDPALCSGFESDGNGVWYKVVGTGVALRAATCDPATTFDTMITIYQGSCDKLLCVISDDNSCGIQSSAKWVALQGVTYFIYIHGRQSSSVGDFALIVEEFTPTEENDFCDGAFAVNTTGTLTLGSTTTATFDNAGDCFVTNSAPGVWYRFNGRGTLVVASLCHPETKYDTALSVYTGKCTDLQCRLGNADAGRPGCGRHSEVSWVAQPDVSYYLLVHGYDVRTGSFGLTVTEPESAVENDYCVNAVRLALSNDVILGTTIEATNDEAPSCTDVEQTGSGVWYRVRGDGNRIVASTCNGDGGEVTDFDTKISVFEGACGSSVCVRANDNTCGEQSTVVWSSIRGVTYYILVHGNTEGNFGLTVDRFVPQQPNDQCGTAIGPVFPDDRVIFGSTVGASFDDAESCSGVSNTGPGVWYFVLGTGERLKADTCNTATDFDSKLSVFTGLECGALQCVAGNDDGCGLRSSVTWDTAVGELYWVLVHGFGTTKVGNFGLTVTGSDIFRL